ncbi:MAG: enoyl-CoA hydratase, partial [Acidimicrobiales bacterium]
MVEGPEAVRLGLATRLSDEPLQEALVMAREIASNSPDAVRAAKRLFRRGPLSDAEAFEMERHEISQLIGSANQVEAVRAYFEKRPPNYADPAMS